MTDRPRCPTCGRTAPGRPTLTPEEAEKRRTSRNTYRRGYRHGRASKPMAETSEDYAAGYSAGTTRVEHTVRMQGRPLQPKRKKI